MIKLGIIAIGIICFVSESFAVTLQQAVGKKILQVYTAKGGRKVDNIPFAEEDLETSLYIKNLKKNDKVLILSHKNLTTISSISQLKVRDEGEVKLLKDVERLHLMLNDNELTIIPTEIRLLQGLRFLYLNGNNLKNIPTSMREIETLEGIYLQDNDFDFIPPVLLTMSQLRKLEMGNNNLTRVSPAIGNLTNLIHLGLSNNNLRTLPDTIGKLKKLRMVEFHNNDLVKIPDSFGSVQIIYMLDISGNKKLTSIPTGKGFQTMPAVIRAKGTPLDLDRLPPSIRAKVNVKKDKERSKAWMKSKR